MTSPKSFGGETTDEGVRDILNNVLKLLNENCWRFLNKELCIIAGKEILK